MLHKVLRALPFRDTQILVNFEGGAKAYDMKPLIDDDEKFKALADETLFKSVRVDAGGIGVTWGGGIDVSCEELWHNGKDPAAIFNPPSIDRSPSLESKLKGLF